ncbi:MAG: DUF3078 domain-containing protein [Coprobacter sp.]|nr:DUF3078 domain-containing protein [Coprobacter sp.]
MIKKYLLLASLAMMPVTFIFAQDAPAKPWKTTGFAGLKFTQSSFTNWASGGENALALDAQFTYQADYKNEAHLWQNRIEFAYGFNQTKDDPLKKTTDKIYLNSNYGFNIHKTLYLSAFLTYQSQFSNGYNYSGDNRTFVSRFMAPAYVSAGLGITWTPAKIFTLVFTPVTWKGTFVLDESLSDQGAFGVKPGCKSLNEGGANLKAELNYDIMKNVNLYSRLNLFTDYCRGKEVKNIDVAWDVQINFTINKWLSASVSTNLIYDNDIKLPYDIKNEAGEVVGEGKCPKVQFKEVLALGLQYNF